MSDQVTPCCQVVLTHLVSFFTTGYAGADPEIFSGGWLQHYTILVLRGWLASYPPYCLYVEVDE